MNATGGEMKRPTRSHLFIYLGRDRTDLYCDRILFEMHCNGARLILRCALLKRHVKGQCSLLERHLKGVVGLGIDVSIRGRREFSLLETKIF
mmetsp:Transcript_24626/g.45564  ORF Transcript_24626/g.45564 Transcript_24626/m.45564 type:complete len:92 (-) Transcript_24626:73-348(-)